jgi:hypothetical protein
MKARNQQVHDGLDGTRFFAAAPSRFKRTGTEGTTDLRFIHGVFARA